MSLSTLATVAFMSCGSLAFGKSRFREGAMRVLGCEALSRVVFKRSAELSRWVHGGAHGKFGIWDGMLQYRELGLCERKHLVESPACVRDHGSLSYLANSAFHARNSFSSEGVERHKDESSGAFVASRNMEPLGSLHRGFSYSKTASLACDILVWLAVGASPHVRRARTSLRQIRCA